MDSLSPSLSFFEDDDDEQGQWCSSRESELEPSQVFAAIHRPRDATAVRSRQVAARQPSQIRDPALDDEKAATVTNPNRPSARGFVKSLSSYVESQDVRNDLPLPRFSVAPTSERGNPVSTEQRREHLDDLSQPVLSSFVAAPLSHLATASGKEAEQVPECTSVGRGSLEACSQLLVVSHSLRPDTFAVHTQQPRSPPKVQTEGEASDDDQTVPPSTAEDRGPAEPLSQGECPFTQLELMEDKDVLRYQPSQAFTDSQMFGPAPFDEHNRPASTMHCEKAQPKAQPKAHLVGEVKMPTNVDSGESNRVERTRRDRAEPLLSLTQASAIPGPTLESTTETSSPLQPQKRQKRPKRKLATLISSRTSPEEESSSSEDLSWAPSDRRRQSKKRSVVCKSREGGRKRAKPSNPVPWLRRRRSDKVHRTQTRVDSYFRPTLGKLPQTKGDTVLCVQTPRTALCATPARVTRERCTPALPKSTRDNVTNEMWSDSQAFVQASPTAGRGTKRSKEKRQPPGLDPSRPKFDE